MKLSLKIRSNIRSFIALLSLAGSITLTAQTPSQEHQIKAIFLFNFTQFVEWPVNSFPNPETPLVIGILGKNPFGSYLKETVSNEKVNSHPLVVQYYASTEEIKNCHVLFVNLDGTGKQEQAIASIKGKSILTVSDGNSFLKQGGIIRFFTKNNKIQLQINPEAAKAADLTISSKLLRLAEIVVPEK